MNLIDSGNVGDGGERKHHRHDAADLEQDLPAILRHQRRGGEAGQRAAERHQADGDDRQRGAQIARRRFGVDGDEVRDDAADAEPGDEAQRGQFGEIGRIGGDEGEDAEQEVGEDQRGLAAVAVADPAKDLRAEQHADIAGAEHEAELLGRDVPFLDQARRRKGDGADIVAVDHGEQHGPDDELDLERAQPVLVQEMRDLNFRRVGHRFPP